MKNILFLGPDINQNNGPSVFSENLTNKLESSSTHITYISKLNFKNHLLKSFKKYDSVIINSANLLPIIYFAQIIIYKKTGKKIFFVLHGEMGKEVTSPIKKKLLQHLQNFLLQQSSSIVFVSTMFMRDFFYSNLNHYHQREKSIVIPNGVVESVKHLAVPDRTKKLTIDIIYVGGKRLEKGYALMREFLQHPFEFKGKKIKIHLIGISETDDIIVQQNIAVYYYPTLAHSEIIEKYNDCDIILSTSLYETYGIAILEAYSRGCKVVSYKKAGVLDLIGEDATVFKYDEQTPTCLYAALLKAIDSKDMFDPSIRSCIPTWGDVSIHYQKSLEQSE